MLEYYVYHLIDPRNGVPFYIGKGKGSRMYDHENMVKNGRVPQNNTYLFRKIKKILKEGLSIQYKKVYENLEEKDALRKEVDEECRLKNDGIKLCNLVPCGSGGNVYKYMSPSKLKQVKQKISKAGKGRIVSEKTREKLKLINLGRIRSLETRQKISVTKTGTKMSKKTREKMSRTHTGLHHSSEHCKSISHALRGRLFSEEHKRKLSDVAKTKVGEKNPNFRPLSVEAEEFIKSNLDKPVYWVFRHLPEKASYGRVKRKMDELSP